MEDERLDQLLNKISDKLVEKLIARMKAEGFSQYIGFRTIPGFNGEWVEVEAKSDKEFIKKADELKATIEKEAERIHKESTKPNDTNFSNIYVSEPNVEPNVCIGGPNVTNSAYFSPESEFNPFMQKNIKKEDYCWGGKSLYEGHDFKIPEEKTNLQSYKEFLSREWKALKELFKKWRQE